MALLHTIDNTQASRCDFPIAPGPTRIPLIKPIRTNPVR